jgi:exonuclease VII small subunit
MATGIATSGEGYSTNGYNISLIDSRIHEQEGQAPVTSQLSDILKRTLSPDLKNLEREEVLKIKLSAPRLNLNQKGSAIELFMLKIEAAKQAGINLEEFAKEAREVIDNKGRLCVEGPQGQLKAELIGAYVKLSRGFNDRSPKSDLQLFELEKASGFPVGGVRLLERAFTQILETSNTVVEFEKGVELVHKIIKHLEEANQTSLIIEKLNLFVRAAKVGWQVRDVIIPQFAPYIVRGNIDEFVEKGRQWVLNNYSDKPRWQFAYQLARHHCDAADIYVLIDQKTAQEHLQKAEKEINDHLWSYRFSWNRTAIEDRKKLAQDHLDYVKKKMTL